MAENGIEAAIAKIEAQVLNLERSDSEQWRELNVVRDRLPNWAVSVLTIGGSVIGFLVAWLGNCL